MQVVAETSSSMFERLMVFVVVLGCVACKPDRPSSSGKPARVLPDAHPAIDAAPSPAVHDDPPVLEHATDEGRPATGEAGGGLTGEPGKAKSPLFEAVQNKRYKP